VGAAAGGLSVTRLAGGGRALGGDPGLMRNCHRQQRRTGAVAASGPTNGGVAGHVTWGSADGDEHEEADELKGEPETQDGEGVVGEAVEDAGAATVPVVPARRRERPHSGHGARHPG
jgi:hypothetical protein